MKLPGRHKRIITSREEIIPLLEKINHDMHNVGLHFKLDTPDDLGYTSYRDEEIPERCFIVMASFDFSYYHQLEFVFYNTIAHNLPADMDWRDHWEKPQLVLLEGNEKAGALNTLKVNQPFAGFVFAFNVGSFGNEQYVIAAGGFSHLFELVFYYDREANEPLKADERVAWWVGRSKL